MRLATWLRTLRHLRPGQLPARVRHKLRGVHPVPFRGPAPGLAMGAPAAPFLPPPASSACADGHRFRLLHREVDLGDPPDWGHAAEGPLWSFLLHQFHWARDPRLAPEARLRLVLDWIRRYPEGYGWWSDPTSFRIMSWVKLLATPGALPDDPAAREAVRRSLAGQLETLAGHLETHLLANHYFTNLAALTLGGLALDGPAADAWLGHEARFRRELDDQLGGDGAHQERAPMYHAALLEQVLDLVNVAAASPRGPAPLREALADAAARMLGALRVYTHPDGGIALFADSAEGFAHRPADLEAYGAALGVAPRGPVTPGWLPDARYARLEAGPFWLLASVGGPAPPHQPGHAHADALAFELDVAGERIVTDTGVTEYVPGPRRDASRATRSHATWEVDGRDQAELWAAHRVGGRPDVRVLEAAPPRRAEAACRSWSLRDTVHHRSFEVTADAVLITDRLEGRPRPVRATLPLAPGLEPRLEGHRAILHTRGGRDLVIELPAGLTWTVERLPFYPELGREQERAALVGRGTPGGEQRTCVRGI